MDVYALIKVLYFADRQALSERGKPITGDAMVAMPYGPVLGQILDEIKAPREIQDIHWSTCFRSRENNLVSLVNPGSPVTDELSDYERGVLKSAREKYAHYKFWELEEHQPRVAGVQRPQGLIASH